MKTILSSQISRQIREICDLFFFLEKNNRKLKILIYKFGLKRFSSQDICRPTHLLKMMEKLSAAILIRNYIWLRALLNSAAVWFHDRRSRNHNIAILVEIWVLKHLYFFAFVIFCDLSYTRPCSADFATLYYLYL